MAHRVQTCFSAAVHDQGFGDLPERVASRSRPVVVVGRGALAIQAAEQIRSITADVAVVSDPAQLADTAPIGDRPGSLEGATVVIVTEPYLPGIGARIRYRNRARKLEHEFGSLARRARAYGADRLVVSSTAFLYGDDEGAPLTTSSPIDPGAETVAAYAAERGADLFRSLGGRSVVLRFGWVFGDHDPMTARVLSAAKKGWQLIDGRPDAWVETVDVSDAASAIAAGLQIPAGIYNVSDGRPVTQATITAVLEEATADRLHPLYEAAWGEPGLLFGCSRLLADDDFAGRTGWRPVGRDFRSFLFEAVRRSG